MKDYVMSNEASRPKSESGPFGWVSLRKLYDHFSIIGDDKGLAKVRYSFV